MGRHLENQDLGQDKILEEEEYLLSPTESQSKIPTNLEEMDRGTIGANIKMEDMDKLWSTKDLMGRGEREILGWHHRLNQ